ncbi:hypothetical protein OnM2_034060 [Erysiphe neolycopersici]|uniref:Chromo domain-containing protein n=1 Tax=Erysiphe neolycopersici TaxID=212602 RepID=A0A420HY60_9PEZI|nr:hypothetical protein OnM2_034060 [Erysiphe neolycopersici]
MVMYGARIKEPLDIAADAIIEITSDPRQLILQQESSESIYPVEPTNEGKYKPALIEAIDAIKILRMRTQPRRNGGIITQYLIRFRGRTAEWDQWLLDRKVRIELRTAYLESQAV